MSLILVALGPSHGDPVCSPQLLRPLLASAKLASILPVLQAPWATVLSLVTISPSPFSPSTCALQETVGDSSLRHPDPTHYPFTLETPPEKVAPGPHYP